MSTDKKTVNIDDLLINPENPRFDPVKSQDEAILTMMDKIESKIKVLAKDIASNGLNPGKLVYVVPHKGKFLVMEGNRRVVALKLLNNPSVVELNKEATTFFEKLQDGHKGQMPSEVDVVVFPNKEDTYHWLELEHTGENKGAGLVKWSSKQKDRFKEQARGKKLSKGMQVLNFMDDNSINVDGITKTNMNRLVSTPEVRKNIGIDFDDGELEIVSDRKEVLGNLDKVAQTMNSKDFNVGKIYKAKQRKEWIKEVLSGNSYGSSGSDSDSNSSHKTTQKRSIPSRRKTLIPRRCVIKIRAKRLNKIYRELKEISVEDYENAVSVLFRVFIEGSLNSFINENNIKVKKSKQHNPTLHEKLVAVGNALALDKDEEKIINKAISDKNSIYSIDTFHAYVHNTKLHPSPKELKTAWDNLEPIMKKIWGSINK